MRRAAANGVHAGLPPKRRCGWPKNWRATTACTSRCFKGNPRLVDRLPAHKTLVRLPPGKSMPIGNLNSQFFANVYLSALDQFVKHELECRWDLRCCDDFVLVAGSAAQLPV